MLRDEDDENSIWCLLTKGERLLSDIAVDTIARDASTLLWRIKALTAGALFGAAEPHCLVYHPARGHKWVAAQSLTYECEFQESDLRASSERLAVAAAPVPPIEPASQIAKNASM